MKKQTLKKFKDLPANNASFMTFKNIRWYNYVLMNWMPSIEKPLIFLPCASANKTRTIEDPRKFISNSMSHQFMSKITRNENYCKVILSEPLTVIPYLLENHPMRMDYNLPVNYLSIQSEFIFIHQLSLILAKIYDTQPKRKFIFYIGGSHHYFILYYANKMINEPFKLIFKIPPRGIRDYSKSAKEFNQTIVDCIAFGIEPNQKRPELISYLKKRGRYTNKAFWESILILQKDKHSKIEICKKTDRITGFSELYKIIGN